VLAPDVVRALSGNACARRRRGPRLAAQVLPKLELMGLLDQVLDRGLGGRSRRALAAGLALRPACAARR
jgi:hypothetical protein